MYITEITPININRIAKIVFTPNTFSTATNNYYYWAGEVAPQVYECETNYKNYLDYFEKYRIFLSKNSFNNLSKDILTFKN